MSVPERLNFSGGPAESVPPLAAGAGAPTAVTSSAASAANAKLDVRLKVFSSQCLPYTACAGQPASRPGAARMPEPYTPRKKITTVENRRFARVLSRLAWTVLLL